MQAFQLSSLFSQHVQSTCCCTPAMQDAAQALQAVMSYRPPPRFQDVGTGGSPSASSLSITSLSMYSKCTPTCAGPVVCYYVLFIQRVD